MFYSRPDFIDSAYINNYLLYLFFLFCYRKSKSLLKIMDANFFWKRRAESSAKMTYTRLVGNILINNFVVSNHNIRMQNEPTNFNWTVFFCIIAFALNKAAVELERVYSCQTGDHNSNWKSCGASPANSLNCRVRKVHFSSWL
jgi:hypothetical protein